MIPDQAIKKAISGGWLDHLKYDRPYMELREKPGGYKDDVLVWGTRPDGKREFTQYYFHEIALDPTFWQSLGKALGKDALFIESCNHAVANGELSTNNHWWLVMAHRFYDLILTGGDTDKFWEDLLKEQPTN